MNYEINKVKIVGRIIDLCKIVNNNAARIFIDADDLRDIDRADILSIIKKFEEKGKLKVTNVYFGDQLNIKGPWDLVKESRHYIEISEIDLNYFEQEYLENKHLLGDHYLSNGQSEFYIYYSSDRRILLNGKIELSHPDFDSENDAVFKYLYERSGIDISIAELKEKTHMSKPIDKVLTNLGFVKGLRASFFDVNKTTIKFKKKIIL